MADISKSTLELKLQKFIIQYGSEQLIEWLDEFDCLGGVQKFKQFKRLEKICCQVFDITIADLHRMTNTPSTDAKRVISFVASGVINFKPAIISKLLGNVSLRSVAYYIKDAEGWINDPKGNRAFVEQYNRVMEKFNAN